MSKYIRQCEYDGCETTYHIRDKKVGNINMCNLHGAEQDAKTPRLGGWVEYSHKTAGVTHIMPMIDAKAILKSAERNGGQGTLKVIVQSKN